MSKTDDLFIFRRKMNPIDYYEYKDAGWKDNDIIQYFSMIDELRSVEVAMTGFKSIDGTVRKGHLDTENLLLKAVNGRLSKQFGKYLDEPIKIEITPPLLRKLVYGEVAEKYASLNAEMDVFRMIHQGVDATRTRFEAYLAYILTTRSKKNEPVGQYIEKVMKLALECSADKDRLSHQQKPEYPGAESTYGEWQKWAKEYERYEASKHVSLQKIERLTKELEELEAKINVIYSETVQNSTAQEIRYIPSQTIQIPKFTDTLYVYSKLPVCVNQHPTASITVNIPCTPEKMYMVNAYYCAQCGKFFISANELERYFQYYKTMPLRIVKLMDAPENNENYIQRREISDLKLSGYNVSASEGLTDKQRQELLASLMNNGSFTKGEIVRHLSMLIETNGARASMAEARRKWSADKTFVMNYRIHEQPKATVKSVRTGSKYLGIVSEKTHSE